MSGRYECSGCGYMTDTAKSLHLHISQCRKYTHLQAAQEELLRCQRKRKREEAGHPQATLARLHNLRSKLNAE